MYCIGVLNTASEIGDDRRVHSAGSEEGQRVGAVDENSKHLLVGGWQVEV